ncbi:MAG: hypothetical protein U5L96_11990 [Owenweeksia sp.]|nr:hypothetical protein [Owenweeksia sp.]
MIEQELERVQNLHLDAWGRGPFSPERYRQLMMESASEACGTKAIFKKIVSWSKAKAAAQFTTYLQDLLSKDAPKWTTELSQEQVAVVGKFLGRIKFFRSERQALSFISTFLRGEDPRGEPEEFVFNTMKSSSNSSSVQKLESIFIEISQGSVNLCKVLKHPFIWM